MRFKRWCLIALGACLAVPAVSSHAQTVIKRDVLAGGATLAQGGSTSLVGTVGQVAIGSRSQGQSTEGEGFWYIFRSALVVDVPQAAVLPTRLALEPIRPNPFGRSFRIHFAVPTATPLRLSIYDVGGRLLRRLHDGIEEPGFHSLEAVSHGLPRGVLFLQMEAGGQRLVRRVVHIE